MSDRELLELAAKAARIEWEQTAFSAGYVVSPGGLFWNPLHDDGDALRLAVKLEMEIDIGRGLALASPLGGIGTQIKVEELADNPLAATRRAIVRAAAEIGKAMTKE